MPTKTTSRVLENAHKITYLVKSYPEHKVADVVGLLALPGIDINTAIWRAQEEGFLAEPDTEKQTMALLKEPAKYEFGQSVEVLKDMLIASFTALAKKETDLEEQQLSIWMQGHPAHDCLIALKVLEEEKKLAQYAIEDGDSTYVFFTLYKNKGKQWGRSQFKKDPLPDENADEDKDSQDE